MCLSKVRVGGNTISQGKTQLFRIYLRVNYFLKLNVKYAGMNPINSITSWILVFQFLYRITDMTEIQQIIELS